MSLAQYEEEFPITAAPKWDRVQGTAVKFFVTVGFQSEVKPSCARAAVRILVSNYGFTYSMNLFKNLAHRCLQLFLNKNHFNIF